MIIGHHVALNLLISVEACRQGADDFYITPLLI